MNDFGILDSVVMKKYPFILSPWLITEERKQVLDLDVVIDWDHFVLSVAVEPPKIDPFLYLRQFKNYSLTCILMMVTILFMLWYIPSILINNNERKSSEGIIELVIWSFLFTLLYIYFKHAYNNGALINILAKEPTLPFKTLSQALTASPEWRVILMKSVYGSVIFPGKTLQVKILPFISIPYQ